MVARRKNDSDEERPKLRPATTPEGRENQLISAAYDLAEKQIHNGTASAQVISHFLKLGSSREKLEQERIAHENELLQVKKETLESAQRVEQLYSEALNAMKAYSGQAPMEMVDDGED